MEKFFQYFFIILIIILIGYFFYTLASMPKVERDNLDKRMDSLLREGKVRFR